MPNDDSINFIYFYILATYKFIFWGFLVCFPWTWDIFTSIRCTRQECTRMSPSGRVRACWWAQRLQRVTQRGANGTEGWVESPDCFRDSVPIVTPGRMSHFQRARQVLCDLLAHLVVDGATRSSPFCCWSLQSMRSACHQESTEPAQGLGSGSQVECRDNFWSERIQRRRLVEVCEMVVVGQGQGYFLYY